MREADLLDVPAAEEAAAAARRRLEQVTELAGLIDETSVCSRPPSARCTATGPLLAAAIRQWLPILSGGVYEEAGVNPADLSIEVKERATGAWRQARLLSGGTREQTYLLLRMAMAQHLVTTAEVAPMLLDEVTAQADAGRRRAILDMLHAMAAERQLILFTHDEPSSSGPRPARRRPTSDHPAPAGANPGRPGRAGRRPGRERDLKRRRRGLGPLNRHAARIPVIGLAVAVLMAGRRRCRRCRGVSRRGTRGRGDAQHGRGAARSIVERYLVRWRTGSCRRMYELLAAADRGRYTGSGS